MLTGGRGGGVSFKKCKENGGHGHVCTSPGKSARSKMRGESESVSRFYWVLPASS